MKLVFTLCSNNYLAQAKILADSSKQHHPDTEFIIGLVDRLNPQIDYSVFSPNVILPCEDLGFAEFADMQRRYDIVEFNTSVKPFYFSYFFKRGYSKVIYLDPDIRIFLPLTELWSDLSDHDILLTPHTITPSHPFHDKWQRIANGVGIYNLGFLALAKSDNTQQLVGWWMKKLENECYMRPLEGLFVDQIWANFFTVYYAKSKVLMDPGYNMGYWNFGERTLSKREDMYFVNESLLKFFHFSNLKLSIPDVISGYSDYTFSQRPDLREIYTDYIALLTNNRHFEFKKIKPTIPLRSDKVGWRKKAGQRIKVHGNRLLNKIVKVVFGTDNNEN